MVLLSGKIAFWQACEKRRAKARSRNEGFQWPQLSENFFMFSVFSNKFNFVLIKSELKSVIRLRV